MRRWTAVLPTVAATTLLLAACNDPSGYTPVGAISLSVVSGDGQSAPPGTELPDPLVVRVEDSRGHKIHNQIVNFRVVLGGGTVFAGAAITNNDGIAQERWTLGSGGPQRLEARAVDTRTGAPLTFAVFTATVTGGTPPSVSINQAPGQPDPTNASPIRFDVAFSEPVTGFGASGVSLAGSTVGGVLVVSVSGSGAMYTVSVTGMSGVGTVVASIPAGVATGGGGAPNTASTSTDNTVTFDGVAPLVTINQAAGQPDPTSTSPILFAVTFSEPVSGFTGSDVSFVGSTVGGALVASVSGTGAAYTVSVSGMAGSGIVMASIPAGAAFDPAGNPSAASTSTDNTVLFTGGPPPTVTINQAAGQPDPTTVAPVLFTVLFSEPVTGFDGSDVSLAGSTVGGTLVASVVGIGANYTVSITGMTGFGTIVASIPAGVAVNLFGTPNTASTSTDNTVTFGTPGAGANLTLSPNALAFGNVAVGSSSPRMIIHVTNTGFGPSLPISAIISGINVADFNIVTNACMGVLLPPGGSCMIEIEFRPTAAGTRTASLTVLGSPDGLRIASLIGTGT